MFYGPYETYCLSLFSSFLLSLLVINCFRVLSALLIICLALGGLTVFLQAVSLLLHRPRIFLLSWDSLVFFLILLLFLTWAQRSWKFTIGLEMPELNSTLSPPCQRRGCSRKLICYYGWSWDLAEWLMHSVIYCMGKEICGLRTLALAHL